MMEEIAPPDCLYPFRYFWKLQTSTSWSLGIFAGSVFVSRRAREFLEGANNYFANSQVHGFTLGTEKLKNSKYGTPAALDHITQRFDETTKRLFRERNDLQFIPFGSPLDKVLLLYPQQHPFTTVFPGSYRWDTQWPIKTDRVCIVHLQSVILTNALSGMKVRLVHWEPLQLLTQQGYQVANLFEPSVDGEWMLSDGHLQAERPR